MTYDTGYDAAYPPSSPPKTQVVLIYSGGDTPHPWTATEIAAQTARFRFPIWVRDNPVDQVQAVNDANAFVAWLHSYNVPVGVYTMLDLETAVNPVYVQAFGDVLHSHGYKVSPYGSTSTLFRNPALDGYFPAEPGATSIPANCVGVQYGYESSIDLDYIAPNLPMWDTQPAAPAPTPQPAPTPTPSGDDDEMPISEVVSFKAGQEDFFQVSPAGDAYHKWSLDGGKTWTSEALPSYIKFHVAKPVVEVRPDGVYVRLEDTGAGRVYQYFQGLNSGWEVTELP